MKRSIKFFVKFSVLAIAVVALCAFDSYAATTSSKTVVVNNKTSQFDEVFSDLGAKTADTTSADLADRIRRQRALLDNKGKADTTGGAKSSGVTGANACDATLRKCMAEKCGSDFTKCSKDSTTIWGEKMDSCRRKTNCSGHEYALLAPEILADRDFNERMSYYNSVISCGNQYNRCIFAECGATLEKCLSKSDGDRAVSKCESVAKECKEQDSGLAARVMSVFGDLRTVAQKQVKVDEARLYELRDLMRAQCNRFGAIFDERTLDCVYTVNFFAGDNTSTPTASKKLYAGDSFTCTPNWFGIDVTTFKENAYRLTRSQTAASSAMLGAGVGVAAGLISSGAIGRALDTQKAEKAAKEECENSGFTWEKGACNKDKPNNKVGNGNDECPAGQHRDDAGNCVADTPAGNVECPTGQHPDESGNCVADTPTDEQGNETTASSPKNSPLPCHMFSEEQEECESYDNCFWMEGPGGGCVDDPQNTSQQEQQETPPATDPATPVTLNLTFADQTNTVKLPATIECKYTNKKGKKVSKKQTAKQDGEVTLSEIPLNAECTIAAVNCSGRTTTAKTLAQMNRPNSFVPLKCEVIDKCVAEGKTWVNNKCQDKPKATDGCDKVCKGLAGKLSAKNPLQVLREANKQCKDTCTPMMKTACGDLVNKTYQSKKITSAKLKIQNVTNDIHYTCEWSTTPVNEDLCSAYDEQLCQVNKSKCTWKEGEGCKKKNDEVTPQNSSRNAAIGSQGGGSSSSQGGSSSCGFNLNASEYTVTPDSTIDLAHCNPDGNHYQRLQKACRKNNTLLVLMSDNKTVKNHRVLEPTMEGNLFKCKARDWWTVKDVNGRFGLLKEWRSETKPSAQSCASTCGQISSFASAEDKKMIEGKEFPGNKQCLEVCASKVESVCAGLVGKQYGNGPVKKTEAVYRVDTSNTLRYSCKLYLTPTLH